MLVIKNVEEVTPELLTSLLQRAGILAHGKVEHIGLRANDAFNSVVTHLEVSYSPDAAPDAPAALLLKLNQNHDGELEFLFYQSQRTAPPNALPIVQCVDTAYDPLTGHSHCLLRDLSSTHQPPVTRYQLQMLQGVPSERHLEQIMHALAAIHAHWWQHPEIGTADGIFAIRPWYRDYDCYQRHIARRQAEWASFSAQVGDQLSTDRHAIYTNALAALPQLWERYLAPRLLTPRQLTITHGDCYLSQFLCPKNVETGTTYLVDFDSASANFATYDLAYLLPTFWTRSQRYEQDREQRLLGRYHQALCAHDVTDYPWETLLADYQLMVTLMIFVPVWDQTAGSPADYWLPKLQCLTDAYEDLKCASLFTRNS